jgi:cellulose synthase/poly-beta-1,6-N-acetylglucosamine synthase-like glycosyltransferase
MITVGIPAFNEERIIAKSIKSALSQISKADEVIVVASGCTDNTVSEIMKVMSNDKRVRLITEAERNGKSSALNLIIQNAKSDIIVQTDGDVELQEGAIQNLLSHFKDQRIGGVSGNPIPVISKEHVFYDWTVMSYRRAGELREQESKSGVFWHLSGYLLAFRKIALPEVPFAKGAVDAWMGKIIQNNGYKMVYEPEAKVFVKAPLTVKDFINQKARVRAGYYNLIKQTGKAPRTVRREIQWLPRELMNVPLARWPDFLFTGFVYLYSWMKGWYLSKTNASLSKIWKIPVSTK